MALLGRLRDIIERHKGTLIGSMVPKTPFDLVGFDATTARAISEDGQLATWPVEEGDGVSDHLFRSPRRVRLQGVVSDTPVRFLAGIHAARSIVENASSTSQDAMRKLYELYEREEPVYVTCRRWTVVDLMITAIEQDEGLDSGDTFDVSVSLQRVRIIRSALVPAQFDLDARTAGGGGTADLGTQNSLDPRDYAGPTSITGLG